MLDIYFWLNFALNLIATFTVYSGPILVYRLIKKDPIEENSSKKICLIYGVFSFILMSFLIFLLNGEGAATATILLYYWLNKWILTHDGKNKSPVPNEESVVDPLAPITPSQYQTTNQSVESMQLNKSDTSTPAELPTEKHKVYDPFATPEKNPSTVARLVAVVSVALCMVSIAINIYLGISYRNSLIKISSYKDTTAKYEQLIDAYEKQVDVLKKHCEDYTYQIQEMEEFNKYSDRIGFMVSADDYAYYHRYDCDTVKNSERYFCHNEEYCKYLGANRCLECHNPTFNIRPAGLN